MPRQKSIKSPSYFLPYQSAAIKQRSRFQIYRKARRIGLTYALAYRYVAKRAVLDGKTWYTANDYGTVLEFIEYCASFARAISAGFDVVEAVEPIDGKEIQTKRLRFRSGGQIIGLSSNPNALHGKGGDVILDEFAYHRDQPRMWEAAQATAGWGDDIIVLSTDTEENNEFDRMAKEAREFRALASATRVIPGTPDYFRLAASRGHPAWTYEQIDIKEAVEQGLVEKINSTKGTAYTREEFLAECRSKCRTEEQWLRQYCCTPSSESSALLPWSIILPCIADDTHRPLSECGDIYHGVDFARRRHLTAIATVEPVGELLHQRDLIRMRGVTWSEQLQRIEAQIAMPNFRRGAYDQTGMGDMPVETLAQKWGTNRIIGVNFTADSKTNLALGLRRRFEDRLVRIPNDRALHESLNSIRSQPTAADTIRYISDESAESHADEFWALALANYAATLPAGAYSSTLI